MSRSLLSLAAHLSQSASSSCSSPPGPGDADQRNIFHQKVRSCHGSGAGPRLARISCPGRSQAGVQIICARIRASEICEVTLCIIGTRGRVSRVASERERERRGLSHGAGELIMPGHNLSQSFISPSNISIAADICINLQRY